MNILVISASMRGGSQSHKVADWLSNHVVSLGVESSVLDLHEIKLPLFDDGETVAENLPQILNELKSAEGYVFVSPEWNGMMSHGLINMLHFVENKEMAYKPVMLVGVSAGRGGTHPIDQMKVLGQKNRHYVISPENLIANGVEKAFNTPDLNSEESDFAVKERADYSLKVLVELATSLRQVRQSGLLNFDRFSNGV